MDNHFVLGLFALYVVVISLYGILSGSCEPCLALVRKVWGRACGLALYFCIHVGLPLLVGIVFIGWGAVNFNIQHTGPGQKGEPGAVLKLDWQEIRAMKESADKDREPRVYPPMPICA